MKYEHFIPLIYENILCSRFATASDFIEEIVISVGRRYVPAICIPRQVYIQIHNLIMKQSIYELRNM